jgi:ATP-dependent Lon protease
MESENSSTEDILNVASRSANVKSRRDSVDDLVFRNPSSRASAVDASVTSQVPIEQLKKSHHLHEHNKKLSNIKGLQRKLEQKVERAKKNFLLNEKLNQLESDDDTVSLD